MTPSPGSPHDFEGRVVIVTGAAGGFGRATCTTLAARGATVIVADIDETGAQQTAAALPNAHAIPTDVCKPDSVKALIHQTHERFGRLDVLVNNAGAPHRIADCEQITTDDFDRQFALNTRSVFLGCKYAIPIMKSAGRGAIINVASIGAKRPRPGLAVYNASKGAVLTFTRAVAAEVAPTVRVCAVAPVSSPTGFGKHATGHETLPAEAETAVIAGIPMGRRAKPNDVAESIAFLASDAAAFLTGVCIDVDGGRSIQ